MIMIYDYDLWFMIMIYDYDYDLWLWFMIMIYLKHPSLGPTSAGIPIPTPASAWRQSHHIANTTAVLGGARH